MDLEYYSDILQLRRGGDVQPPKTKKYFRSTKSGAGMTAANELQGTEEKILDLN